MLAPGRIAIDFSGPGGLVLIGGVLTMADIANAFFWTDWGVGRRTMERGSGRSDS
jgi:hypothetical protein